MSREHWLLPKEPFADHARYRSARGGAIEKARAMSPDELLDALDRSGLRGRGGAGFPTGKKWRSVAQNACPTRYVVCNAAEGEPGTFKDRYLLRRDPYAVIEGMLIAAHTIRAKAGYVAIKASFKKEIARVRQAIAEMTADGLFNDFRIDVVEGPEEYLFGEEKALLNVIEGEGPLPRPADEPPYELGLFASAGAPNPALVNNVETFAHVASIVRAGADSFRGVGTREMPGTVLFTLSGDLRYPGVYELPSGITLRRLLYGVGGGPREGRTIKAVLSGVSTGIIVPELFEARCDFDQMARIGSGLGSAGFIVYDDQTNMARLAQTVARFLYVESCDQCSACKTGLRIASESLDALSHGAPSSDLLERARIAVQHAPQGNRCYLPVQASILVQSLLRHFAGELERGAPESAPEVILPKMIDFDEESGTFLYDHSQAHKQPDWTYRSQAGITLEEAGRLS